VASSPDPLRAAEAVRRVRPGTGPLDVLYLTVAEAVERGADVGRGLAEAVNRVEVLADLAKATLYTTILKIVEKYALL